MRWEEAMESLGLVFLGLIALSSLVQGLFLLGLDPFRIAEPLKIIAFVISQHSRFPLIVELKRRLTEIELLSLKPVEERLNELPFTTRKR